MYSAGYDHQIICWDLEMIQERIEEKEEMREADVESRQHEVYKRFIKNNAGK
jgi:hypothetical protein